MPVYALNPEFPGFPDPRRSEKNGLLAIGGSLDPDWLYSAYSIGVFPWFNEPDPILWWSPDPRCVVRPGEVKLSSSMKQLINSNIFELRIDTAFENVIEKCRTVCRKDQDETWITKDMLNAYNKIHRLGLAHSFETWHEGVLVGGLYGVSLGRMFFGESMFTSVSNASKFAFISLSDILKRYNFDLIDCQVTNPHLISMGCIEMKRKDYLKIVRNNDDEKTIIGNWGNLLNF